MLRRQTGFTLIELLIVIAVLVIVAAIAIPAYTSFVQKSARSDAMSGLMDIRLKQESYRMKNPTYAIALSSLSISSSSTNGKYTLAVVASSSSATSFRATAVPVGSQASDDCGTFAINANGPLTGGSYADSSCWKR